MIQHAERYLLLLVTYASDLLLRTNKLYSVLFFLSWSSMLVAIHRCVAVCAVNCTVDGRSCCSQCSSHRSIARHSTPQLGGPRWNMFIRFGIKIENDGFTRRREKFDSMFIRFDRIHERDRQTDRHRTMA